MFNRRLFLFLATVSGLLLGASSAMASSMTDSSNYLSDHFNVLIHYQGTVSNPVRSFSDSLFDQLDQADFLKKDEKKIIELGKNYFLHNDLLIVGDFKDDLTYLVIPMPEADVARFVATIQQGEAVEKSKNNNREIYASFKGNRFAFTYWEGALLLTDSKKNLTSIVAQLENTTVSPMVSALSSMPADAFLSAFLSNDAMTKKMDETIGGAYGSLLDLNEYAWYALRDLGSDHYAMEQYTSWNDTLFQTKKFNLSDFTFTPELYKKLPGGDVMFYFEVNDIYDYVMKWVDVMELDQLLNPSSSKEENENHKSGSSVRMGAQFLDTIETYRPYLELLNNRLGIVVQWNPADTLPRVTLLTEVADENMDVIRELNALILPFVNGAQCTQDCPEVTQTDEREGALYTIQDSISHYVFGEHNGYYVLSNVGDILAQIDSGEGSLLTNSSFMNYFNKYGNGRTDLTNIGFYEISSLVKFALESFSVGNDDVIDATAFVSQMGPWYFQGTAGNYWSKAIAEVVIPVRAAIDSLVPMIVSQWNDKVDQPDEMKNFEAKMKFKDLEDKDTSWYAKDLVSLANDKIVDDSQTSFRPNDPISRAEFATLMVRQYGWENEVPTKNGAEIFDDVPADAWYNGKIGLAYEYGILKGDSNGKTVRPNDPITRAEAAQVLVNVSGLLQEAPQARSQFDDVPKDSWYADAVDRTYDQKIVRGVSETKFEPTRFLTRAEAIVLINRVRESELRFGWMF